MKNRLLPTWPLAFFMALILIASPALLIAQAADSVTASDQASDGSSVVVANVTAAAPGWIVIHIDSAGSPGPVLGQSAVAAGDNTDVVVALDPPLEGDTTLWAMLHVDEGVVGEYEFPGADVPVRAGDMVVMTPFVATVATMEVDVEPTAEPEEEAEAAAQATPEPEEEAEVTAEATPAAEEEAVDAADALTETAALTETQEVETMAEPDESAPPEVLPVTGAGMSGIALAAPALLAVLGALGAALWVGRRRR